ncbi:MAG: Aldehyde Dehydrogenase [Chthonomonadaceae bacterium]|nr:Aldehyde Dehydrogenase [Chthonomonadaceae bacterium]
MELHGLNIIGNSTSAEGTETFTATNPATGAGLDAAFHIATEAEVNRAVELAAQAFPSYRGLPAEARAKFLERIAEEIVELGDALLELANRETALPLPRLIGERGRTVGQLKMFAALLREGSWVDARIDRALPDRQPLPRPDLRRMLLPLGPVAVFGASNFPFAFSVAGGDTASALAAGCPVVVKAHPAHPGTSELVARAIERAALVTGMPEGVFSMVHGMKETGLALVRHPKLEAVGFTGSLGAGRALYDAAAARPKPIPVYAEMGSVNPVFVLPGALAERGEKIAEGLAQSVTLGVGQFCTNPGVVVGLQSEGLTGFLRTAAERLSAVSPGTMLYPHIQQAFVQGTERLKSAEGVRTEAEPQTVADGTRTQVNAALFSTDAAHFLGQHDLREEVFGPTSLVVACGTPEELESVANSLEGQLTATVHANADDLKRYRGLISILETKVGRLLFNGFPTGVEVSAAMQHGGPYPATSDSRTTSVGTAAILRFVRPLCYQDCPQELLPAELQDANPLQIRRLVDSEWTR